MQVLLLCVGRNGYVNRGRRLEDRIAALRTVITSSTQNRRTGRIRRGEWSLWVQSSLFVEAPPSLTKTTIIIHLCIETHNPLYTLYTAYSTVMTEVLPVRPATYEALLRYPDKSSVYPFVSIHTQLRLYKMHQHVLIVIHGKQRQGLQRRLRNKLTLGLAWLALSRARTRSTDLLWLSTRTYRIRHYHTRQSRFRRVVGEKSRFR